MFFPPNFTKINKNNGKYKLKLVVKSIKLWSRNRRNFNGQRQNKKIAVIVRLSVSKRL